MRVVLASNVIIHGEVRSAGYVVDGDDAFCTQLVSRGLASRVVAPVDVIAESVVAPVDVPAFVEAEAPRHAPKAPRHRPR